MRIVLVIAHPDDEAFGPGGTIAKCAKRHDVFIICATKGQAGKDSWKIRVRSLGEERRDELRRSAKILGVQKVFFLGFEDGKLSQSVYHELAKKLEGILRALRPKIIIAPEPRGISGHIDHVTVSMVSSFVYEKLNFVKTILYYCITEKRAKALKGYFIYVPPGYKESEIDLKIDIRDVWDQKVRAMMEHTSQVHDIKRILARAKKFPKEENFLVALKGIRRKNIRALRRILGARF